jgi:hypothetical protein
MKRILIAAAVVAITVATAQAQAIPELQSATEAYRARQKALYEEQEAARRKNFEAATEAYRAKQKALAEPQEAFRRKLKEEAAARKAAEAIQREKDLAEFKASVPYDGESAMCREARQKGDVSYKAICDLERNNQAEKQREKAIEAKAQAAERERRRQEYEAARPAREAAEREAARIEALPSNRLFNGYRLYGYVKFCNEVREGYMVQYVSDIELERARKAIKAIAARATKDDASINTDDVWQKARGTLDRLRADDVMCHNSLVELLNVSPEPVFNIEKP